jgi:hypothetical protein
MNDDTAGWIAVGISALTLLNLFFLLLSAYWKLPLAEQQLANSRIVLNTRSVWTGNDPVSRLNRLCAVALVFTMRGLLEKRGLIDKNEADHVPLGLRVWTAGPLLTSCLVFVGGISFWVMAKLASI